MLKATAYAALIEALRSQGKFREGNRIGRLLLDEGNSNFAKSIAYYEMAYNLAEMEEDLDEALELRPPVGRAGAGRDQAVPAGGARLGALQAEGVRQGGRLPRPVERAGSFATTLTHLGMALLASGQEDRARTVLAHARNLGDRGEALQEKMMECMKDSTRLIERARRGQRK